MHGGGGGGGSQPKVSQEVAVMFFAYNCAVGYRPTDNVHHALYKGHPHSPGRMGIPMPILPGKWAPCMPILPGTTGNMGILS